MATTKIDTLHIADEAVELTQIIESLRKCSVVATIETVAVGVYTVILNAPFDGTIETLHYALGGGANSTFEIEIDDGTATEVTFTGSVTSFIASGSTTTSIAATGTNTFSGGDIIQIDVTANSSGTNLLIQLDLIRTAL